MANAKKCDICGSYYDTYSNVKLDNGMTLNGCRIRIMSEDGYSWTDLDLCQECMTKVHTLLCDISSEKEA